MEIRRLTCHRGRAARVSSSLTLTGICQIRSMSAVKWRENGPIIPEAHFWPFCGFGAYRRLSGQNPASMLPPNCRSIEDFRGVFRRNRAEVYNKWAGAGRSSIRKRQLHPSQREQRKPQRLQMSHCSTARNTNDRTPGTPSDRHGARKEGQERFSRAIPKRITDIRAYRRREFDSLAQWSCFRLTMNAGFLSHLR